MVPNNVITTLLKNELCFFFDNTTTDTVSDVNTSVLDYVNFTSALRWFINIFLHVDHNNDLFGFIATSKLEIDYEGIGELARELSAKKIKLLNFYQHPKQDRGIFRLIIRRIQLGNSFMGIEYKIHSYSLSK